MHEILEHLRVQIAERVGSSGEPVTASLGAALLRSDESHLDWRNRADKALYEAKNAGRNGFVIAKD